jgi:hypothetical protein
MIREGRQKKFSTQTLAIAALGWDISKQSRLSRLENGDHAPTLTEIKLLIQVFGLDEKSTMKKWTAVRGQNNLLRDIGQAIADSNREIAHELVELSFFAA